MRLLYNTLGSYPINLIIIIYNSNICFVVKGYSGIIGMPGLWFDSEITYMLYIVWGLNKNQQYTPLEFNNSNVHCYTKKSLAVAGFPSQQVYRRIQ